MRTLSARVILPLEAGLRLWLLSWFVIVPARLGNFQNVGLAHFWFPSVSSSRKDSYSQRPRCAMYHEGRLMRLERSARRQSESLIQCVSMHWTNQAAM